MKRPKLSLDTSTIASTIGSRSTSLRLDTLSVTDPTSRNTFSNAWEVNAIKPQRPLLDINLQEVHASSLSESSYTYTTTPVTTTSSPATYTSPSSTSSLSTSSSSSIVDIAQPPYRLPFTTTSILLNGPIARKRKRSPQPIFPSTKRVSFRTELTEDIVTSTYVLAHSDLDNANAWSNVPESSLVIRKALSKPGPTMLSIPDTSVEITAVEACTTSRHDGGEDADVDVDHDTCPVTPVAGRRKRMRDWVWTLGPITT
ncbi:hypothetical protein MBLNU457_g2523t1 [Dothideomycetes sp. NU457]